MSTARFEAFAASLPSLVAKQAPLRPWDPSRFIAWLCTTPLSHGELLAARFLLPPPQSLCRLVLELGLTSPAASL